MCMYMYQRVTRSEVAVSVKRRYNVILVDTAYSRDREKSKTLEYRKMLRFFDLNLNPWRIEIWKWIGGKKTFLFLFQKFTVLAEQGVGDHSKRRISYRISIQPILILRKYT